MDHFFRANDDNAKVLGTLHKTKDGPASGILLVG